MKVLLVPGLGNSGQGHWMVHWERALPAARAELDNWDDPYPQEWVANLDAAVSAAGSDIVLVAHSLGCACVVHWAAKARPIRAALLVAPADVDSDAHVPPPARRFGPMPMLPLPFPATVIASTSDPYANIGRSQAFAAAWGAKFRNIGAKGHINADSALGSWPEGRAILENFVRG